MGKISSTLNLNADNDGFTFSISCTDLTLEELKQFAERASLPIGQGMVGSSFHARNLLDAFELMGMYVAASQGRTSEESQQETQALIREFFSKVAAAGALRILEQRPPA